MFTGLESFLLVARRNSKSLSVIIGYLDLIALSASARISSSLLVVVTTTTTTNTHSKTFFRLSVSIFLRLLLLLLSTTLDAEDLNLSLWDSLEYTPLVADVKIIVLARATALPILLVILTALDKPSSPAPVVAWLLLVVVLLAVVDIRVASSSLPLDELELGRHPLSRNVENREDVSLKCCDNSHILSSMFFIQYGRHAYFLAEKYFDVWSQGQRPR